MGMLRTPELKTRLNILKIWVDPLSKEECLNKVGDFLKEGTRVHSVFASNPEKNFSVPKDSLLYETYKSADLLLPDGVGIVLAARILYGAKLARVAGSDFIYDICELATREKYKVFVYGAKEEVNKISVEKLSNRYPGLQIVGRANGYVNETEMPELINCINASKADILFLALGSPKQEKWFAKYRNSLDSVKVCQGVGGTLDTIAGTVKRAPGIWQKCSAEWLYRLLVEPARIKRQKMLPIFAGMVFWAYLKNLLKR